MFGGKKVRIEPVISMEMKVDGWRRGGWEEER